MQIKKLSPDQIITLNDYPVHNEQVLKIYFRIFKHAPSLIPPVPVLHKTSGLPFAPGRTPRAQKYNELLRSFLQTHPYAEYFLLDGTHRTTAAALTRQKILAMVFTNDKDIKQARMLAEQGKLISLTTGKTIKNCIEVLQKHFYKTEVFQTVQEKTQRMVKERVLPKHMTLGFQ